MKTAKSGKERHEDGKERHFERARVGSQWKYFVNQPALAVSYELLHERQKRIGSFRRPPSVFLGDQTSPVARIQSLSRRPRVAGTATVVRTEPSSEASAASPASCRRRLMVLSGVGIRYALNLSSSAFASFKSAVSNPSV